MQKSRFYVALTSQADMVELAATFPLIWRAIWHAAFAAERQQGMSFSLLGVSLPLSDHVGWFGRFGADFTLVVTEASECPWPEVGQKW